MLRPGCKRSVLPVELDCRLPYRRRHHRACVFSYALRGRTRRFRTCSPSTSGHQRHSEKGASKNTLLNFGKVKKVAEAALGSVTVDEKASTSSLMRMALAFKSASGDQGISGSVYWTDPDYYVDGVGSSVLLDEDKNLELFSELAKGTHRAGTVGTLAEQQS